MTCSARYSRPSRTSVSSSSRNCWTRTAWKASRAASAALAGASELRSSRSFSSSTGAGPGKSGEGALDADGGVDEDELASFEDPEDRSQTLHGGVAAHRVVRQRCGDVVPADLAQRLMPVGPGVQG